MKKINFLKRAILHILIKRELKKMKKTQVNGQVRHILTLVGGVLVALGVVDNEIVQQGQEVIFGLIGAGVAAYAFVKSFLAKEKVAPK